MSSPEPPDDPRESEGDRRRTNLIMLAVAIFVVIAGVWLVNTMVDMRKRQECIESGRHNCNPIETRQRDSW
jgi:hypothetical protein